MPKKSSKKKAKCDSCSAWKEAVDECDSFDIDTISEFTKSKSITTNPYLIFTEINTHILNGIMGLRDDTCDTWLEGGDVTGGLKARVKEAREEGSIDRYFDKERGVFKGEKGTGERYVNMVLSGIARGLSEKSSVKIATTVCHKKYGDGACMGIQEKVLDELGISLED